MISRTNHDSLIIRVFFFFFFFTKQASSSLLVVLVTFWKIALCYNGLFHFTLKSEMHAIHMLVYSYTVQ